MSVAAKICGLTDAAAASAAVASGARFVGVVFYPPSSRHLSPPAAAALLAGIAPGITRVGVFVDPQDAALDAVLGKLPLDLIQLHGKESPERVAAIKARFRRPVMKAIPVAVADDLDAATPYIGVADWLMFDAKPPAGKADALPGGNGLALDWRLLGRRSWPLPWMLSGGLDGDNLAEAVRLSGATVVDVSSGVEQRPGVKDPTKIHAFLARARQL